MVESKRRKKVGLALPSTNRGLLVGSTPSSLKPSNTVEIAQSLLGITGVLSDVTNTIAPGTTNTIPPAVDSAITTSTPKEVVSIDKKKKRAKAGAHWKKTKGAAEALIAEVELLHNSGKVDISDY